MSPDGRNSPPGVWGSCETPAPLNQKALDIAPPPGRSQWPLTFCLIMILPRGSHCPELDLTLWFCILGSSSNPSHPPSLLTISKRTRMSTWGSPPTIPRFTCVHLSPGAKWVLVSWWGDRAPLWNCCFKRRWWAGVLSICCVRIQWEDGALRPRRGIIPRTHNLRLPTSSNVRDKCLPSEPPRP